MTASRPPATAHDGWARERKHERGEPRNETRATGVTQTVDGGMGVKGKTKDGLKEEEESAVEALRVSGLKNYPSPLALLLFLPFKELHNFK